MTALDHNTPLTAERLEWIRRCNREDKARHGASWEDHGEPAERHRDELLAEVDRLTKHIAAYDHMNKVVDGDWQEEVDRLKTDKTMLRAHLAAVTSERDKAVRAVQHMADAMAKVGPAIQRAMRLIAAGDAAGAAAVLGDVAPEAPEGGETP